MIHRRVQKSPQENLWAIQMVLNFNSKTIVGPDKISYLFSYGGDSRGGTGTLLDKFKKDKGWEFGHWDSYSKNLTPCFS